MPFGVEKAALLGAAGAAGGGEITGGSRNDSMGDGYFYETFAASGTLTVSADMTIDMIVVGGGGGWHYGSAVGSEEPNTGGGGGGGVTYVTGLEVTAGDYTVVIGALGSNGASPGGYGTNGDNSKITIGGCQISGGGGGAGGAGGTGYAGNGEGSNHGSQDTSPNRGSSGGAGGAGFNTSAAGTGGTSGSERTGGSPPTGTFTVTDGGAGGTPVTSSFSGGGGGAGYGANAGTGGSGGGKGYEGILWNNFPTSTSRYGQGAGGIWDNTTPNSNPIAEGVHGRGSSRYRGLGNAGVIIARWAV